MNTTLILTVLLGAVALVAIALVVRTRVASRRSAPSADVSGPAQASTGTALVSQAGSVEEAPLPAAIHFGSDVANPAVKVRPLPLVDFKAFEGATVVEPALGVASRLSGLMQAAPSLLVAEAHRGRQLMEVVIDGTLIRAADGNGFRAMAMGADGIKEHARLFATDGLTSMVNAAAVWQLASVVVAQKHMADISQKLGEIKDAVNDISEFLDSERRAVIEGTYQYLQQAYEVLAQGELSQEIRDELESCERDLLKVQKHLVSEIHQRAQSAPRDDDTFGTESLHKNAVAKYRGLSKSVDDLKLCLMTRALCWYVLTLYPGAQALKAVRRDDIKQGLEELKSIQAAIQGQTSSDLERFKSMWNRDNTLEERKSEVRSASQRAQELLDAARLDTAAQLDRSHALLLERDVPTQLVVELVDGVIRQVRQRELMAA